MRVELDPVIKVVRVIESCKTFGQLNLALDWANKVKGVHTETICFFYKKQTQQIYESLSFRAKILSPHQPNPEAEIISCGV
jgi:hypothetical protein